MTSPTTRCPTTRDGRSGRVQRASFMTSRQTAIASHVGGIPRLSIIAAPGNDATHAATNTITDVSSRGIGPGTPAKLGRRRRLVNTSAPRRRVTCPG